MDTIDTRRSENTARSNRGTQSGFGGKKLSQRCRQSSGHAHVGADENVQEAYNRRQGGKRVDSESSEEVAVLKALNGRREEGLDMLRT